eukprot:m.249157 g.249157  ORF g.249157 m.249157 type:complete len:306 (+) comp19515_c0_seq5:204-1121(+)
MAPTTMLSVGIGGFLLGLLVSQLLASLRVENLDAVKTQAQSNCVVAKNERKEPSILSQNHVNKYDKFCKAVSVRKNPAGKGAASTKLAYDFNVAQYLEGGGDDVFQHSHDYLGIHSVIVEIGGNKGIFANTIHTKYNPKELHVIEPVTPMYVKLQERFQTSPAVMLHKFALSRTGGSIKMAYRTGNDAAAKFFPAGTKLDRGWEKATVEDVELKTFSDAWQAMGLDTVDLMNINIEGAEFEVVEALLAANMQGNIKNLQIQFHAHAGIDVDDRIGKRCEFHKILRRTHELVYNFDWVWEQWTLKT